MSFAERMRTSRNQKGYSQEYLAERIGVSRQTITKWESETGFPEMKKTLQLAMELQVSLDWLFEDELKELGWKALVDCKNSIISAEDRYVPQRKVDGAMIQETIDKLYMPVVNGNMLTGIRSFDTVDEGLRRGNVYYVYGAPVIGKLSFALNIVVNYLHDGRNVMIALKEHTVQSVLRSIICIDAEVNSYVHKPKYSVEESERISNSAEFMKDANLIFDDAYDESIDKLYEKCLNTNQQLDLVVIDSARLLYTMVADKKTKNGEKRIHAILSYIARECRCAVMVLDRIDKSVEDLLVRHDEPEKVVNEFLKKSVLSEAENILFFHRADYYKFFESNISQIDMLYHDGYHGKGTQYIKFYLNKATEKVKE